MVDRRAVLTHGRADPPPTQDTDATAGLTEAEATRRRSSGQGNRVRQATSRTYQQIIRDNLLSFLNVTLIAIGVVLIAIGQTKDAFLSSGLAVINAAIGVVQETIAKRRLDRIALLNRATTSVVRDGQERQVDPDDLVVGDILVARAGDQIMLDGRVIGDGTMEVDESLLTGETEEVEKKAGDPVYAGSFCASGSARYQAEKVGSDTLANNIAAGARAYRIALTPLQRDVNLIVRLLLVIVGFFLAMLFTASVVWDYSINDTVVSAAVVLGIVPPGLFLMITLTYSIAALRLANRDALIQQMNAVESLSNVNVFAMDKTGTLTANKLNLSDVQPITGDDEQVRKVVGAFAASVGSGTKTTDAIAASIPSAKQPLTDEVPFSSARKWSAISADSGDLKGVFALGAPEMLGKHIQDGDAKPPEGWVERGLRVLLFARSASPRSLHDEKGEPVLPDDLASLAWLGFTDELRPHSKRTLDGFREAGIELKIISGDNAETVAALARQAGVGADAKLVSGLDLAEMDDAQFDQAARESTIFGRITPEQKERLIDALKRGGQYVAMTGDGVNDVLSLKKANLGIAMQSGSQATRAAADIVLLNDSFGALPAAFLEGKRIRMGLQGVMALFLTRVFVVTLVIMMVAVIQAAFPFSPGHMSVLTTLTVGIPTFGLALWAHPGTPPRSLIRALIEFVVPASLLLAVAAFAVYASMYFIHDVTLETFRGDVIARTQDVDQLSKDALTYLLILAGLFLVVFAAPPNEWFAVIEKTDHDWRPTWLAIAMLPIYVVIVAIQPLRDFFGLHTMAVRDYSAIAAIAIGWALLLRWCWKVELFGRLFGYASVK